MPYPSDLIKYCHLCPSFKSIGQMMDPKEVTNYKSHVLNPNNHKPEDAKKPIQCPYCLKTYDRLL